MKDMTHMSAPDNRKSILYLHPDQDIANSEGIVWLGAKEQEALVQIPQVHHKIHQHEHTCMHTVFLYQLPSCA